MKFTLTFLLTLLLAYSCSSTKKETLNEEREHENIKREYTVIDSNTNKRPGWIENAPLWAKVHGKNLIEKTFFSVETDPYKKRSLACSKAKATAYSDIGREIATFIDKTLASSEEGAAAIDENNPNTRGVKSYIEDTLSEKVQALIHGARVEMTYWEKRKYQKELGAKKDFRAYICAVFVSISNKRLQTAIDEAANFVVNQIDDSETKNNVKKALNKISDDFIKAKNGEI